MRSRARATWLAIACAWCVGALSALTVPSVAIASLEEMEILDALDEVSTDPNLSPERTVRVLRFTGDKAKPKERSGWLEWLEGLFRWIGGASRLIWWILIALGLGLLALFLKRVFRELGAAKGQSQAQDAPTHVQELDIRPESLPEDIGGAALRLWQTNDHRAALALLYRGLLSRLVHSHGVPIRESTTEADCLQLAIPRLPADVAEYVALLVRVWQHTVYGAKEPSEAGVRTLCDRFDRSFPLVDQTIAQTSGSPS